MTSADQPQRPGSSFEAGYEAGREFGLEEGRREARAAERTEDAITVRRLWDALGRHHEEVNYHRRREGSTEECDWDLCLAADPPAPRETLDVVRAVRIEAAVQAVIVALRSALRPTEPPAPRQGEAVEVVPGIYGVLSDERMARLAANPPAPEAGE